MAHRYGWNGLYCILAYYGFHKMIDSYPAIRQHLGQYEEALKKRGQVRYTSSGKPKIGADFPGQHHWLELDNNPRKEYLDVFDKRKIVFSRISGNHPCFAIDENRMLLSDTGYTITGDSLDYLINELTSDIVWFAFRRYYMGGGIEKEFKVNNLLNLPICPPKTSYGLTEEEIAYISSSFNA